MDRSDLVYNRTWEWCRRGLEHVFSGPKDLSVHTLWTPPLYRLEYYLLSYMLAVYVLYVTTNHIKCVMKRKVHKLGFSMGEEITRIVGTGMNQS
ncbi:hypothetical protein GYMLUDRAFT_551125 [Collybiopsis luxurians FD-317 M1]|uniref:Uncharacterized protein n=1 Tax=Collybiopsis luxurians FD-317 M1 TaxID=944289 RepID=A0A0D0BEB8_9AGAR|nr:hypothetical protein GYMLUDRAFT_551125 [Collybiopsis luxurians FD-317 M1]